MKRGLEARMKLQNSDCSPGEYGGDPRELSKHGRYCANLYQISKSSSMTYFNQSAEYRQKIEEMKANLSQ
jgi:hypothetical protein